MRHTGFRILAGGQNVSNDTWVTGINNNDVIIGPSGAGKTRGYVKPNLLQMDGSMVVTDTKRSLRQEAGPVLERHGYQVLELDLTDPLTSPWGCNPLAYVRYDERRQRYSEQDILTVSAALVPIEDFQQPFWELAARMFLECMVGYVLECLPEEEHDLCSVARLFGETGSGNFDRLMKELCQFAPDCFTAMRYKMSQAGRGADKMYSSILGILAEKLSPFTFDGARALFQNQKQVDIRQLAAKKTVVFLNVSDTDPSNYRLANLFYTQALHTLCGIADKSPGHRLNIPVRFILDDFAANVCIPDFDRIISVIRSREIAVSIIIQSLSQLEALYGHARALTILNNCDHLLYLGGQDVETASFIARKANKTPSSILQMPLDAVWLFARGSAPREAAKYRLESHPLYKELPEYQAAHKAQAQLPQAGPEAEPAA